MKHYIFADKIEIEPVNKLLDFINSNDDCITILVDTKGGVDYVFDYLMYFLNLNKDRITLMAGQEITSNGFWIFYEFQGKRIVGESTLSLIHKTHFDINTNDLDDKDSAQYKQMKTMEKKNLKAFEIFKPHLTKSEQVKFKKGFAIYLGAEKIREICKIWK